VIFAAAFFELCTHCCKPVLEDIDDRVADLGRRKGGSVYEPTPTIDFIFGADDHFIGVAIHPDKALGFLNPSHQIVDAHGLGLHWRPQRSNLAPFTPRQRSFTADVCIGSGIDFGMQFGTIEKRLTFEQYWLAPRSSGGDACEGDRRRNSEREKRISTFLSSARPRPLASWGQP
jgi:hypothetical protein